MDAFFLDLNLNSIKNFIRVADIGNITSAAEALFLSQPTLSRQIAQLERSLGAELLLRKKRGVSLTPQGKAFYDRSKKFLAAYDEYASAVFDLRGVVAGTLNIAHQQAASTVVTRFHKYFLRQYPNVIINNYRQERKNFIDGLLSKEFHFAYLYPGELEHYDSRLKSIPILSFKNALLVSAESPLSKRKAVSLAELRDERFIMPSKINSKSRFQEIIENCSRAGFYPDIACCAEHMEEFIMEVVRYDGVAILPHLPAFGNNTTRWIALEDFAPNYPISLVWDARDEHPLIPVYLRAFSAQIDQVR